MKKWISLMMVLLLSVAVGCGGDDKDKDKDKDKDGKDKATQKDGGTPDAEVTETAVIICGSCGVAGAKDHKCDAAAEKCEHGHCGFAEGSALCCTKASLADTEGKMFCKACGEEAGGEACCKDDAEVCADCKLHKGSPLCCKLTKIDGH